MLLCFPEPVKELGSRKGLDAAPWIQYEEVFVARHDDGRSGGKRWFEILVVRSVTAVPDRFHWLYPKCGRRQECEGFRAAGVS